MARRAIALAATAALVALAPLPAQAAGFRAGAAHVDFTPPAALPKSGCLAQNAAYPGPRKFDFEEPFVDQDTSGSYDLGEPYLDCNMNGRWDGNLLGGGADTPRRFDKVFDDVGARALVVSNSGRTIAVEVVDQEGLFNTYIERIRAAVRQDGYKLDGIFVSANHDESAPDTLGLSGVGQTTSGVNDYFVDYLVRRSALAIERAYRARRPARLRFAEAIEPANLRQCWSSYPFVDDQLMPALQAVGRKGRVIATLANVSQHAESLGFNEDPSERLAISSDWIHFFRQRLERQGGVAIEMAGSVGSVETPEVFGSPISRVPQVQTDEDHPAGCRTLFTARGTPAPTGYRAETRQLGLALAGAVGRALARHGRWSRSRVIWGRRAQICLPVTNQLFVLGAAIGIFGNRPAYGPGCSAPVGPLPGGSTTGSALRSDVAAFRIGDGEFISVPGEVFPFTFLRGPLGPADMPDPGRPMPAWPIPHMHAPYRFVEGLGEDMVGYIFPSGNGVGVPGENGNGLDPSSTDRFGCNHSDDSEASSSDAANLIAAALVKLLDRGGRQPERIAVGRYVLADGSRSRDPLGQRVPKCDRARAAGPASPAVAAWVKGHGRVKPAAWMSLSGRRQSRPDRNTRGFFDSRGRRVWLDVFKPIASSGT